jgi:hypothetical protein
MKGKETLEWSVLIELLEYKDGKFYWKERDVKWFQHCKNPKRMCSQWNGRFKGKEALNYLDSEGYYTGRILRRLYQTHRVVWFYHMKKWPKFQIDHINHIRNDNRIENLRDVEHKENQKNQTKKKNNTSGYSGVSFLKNYRKWEAYIYENGKKKNLGYYDFPEEASKIVQKTKLSLGYHKNHGI